MVATNTAPGESLARLRYADDDGARYYELFQALLGLPEPIYLHHELVADDQGIRLAKRHDALSLRALRESGKSPAELITCLPATFTI